MSRDGVPHQLVGQGEGGGCIAGPAAQSRLDGDLFLQREVNRAGIAGCVEHHPGGANRQVLRFRSAIRTFHRERNTLALPPLGNQLVRQIDQAEQRLDAMISVVLLRQHSEEEVELGPGG